MTLRKLSCWRTPLSVYDRSRYPIFEAADTRLERFKFFNVSTTIWWLHTYQDVDIFGIESIVQRERQVTPLVGIGGVIEVFLLSLEIVVDYVRPRVVPKLP